MDYLALEDRWIRKAGTPVKAYGAHVRDLPPEPETEPSGLPPQQPSVRPLMAELGRSVAWYFVAYVLVVAFVMTNVLRAVILAKLG